MQLIEPMQLIAQKDNQRVWLTRLQQSDAFPSPCAGEEFVALIVVYDDQVSNDNRNIITDALINQGCRYGVCMGYDCSGWDDALDWSYLATDLDWNPPNWTPPEERFVMSSWHENEPLKDTIFSFIKCTKFDEFVPKNFVVVVVGDGPHAEIVRLVRAELTAVDGD